MKEELKEEQKKQILEVLESVKDLKKNRKMYRYLRLPQKIGKE